MLWDLLRADSTDDEDRCRLSGTDNETDQLNGLGVTPLQIVDDQQTRAVGDHDGSGYSIEQPMALSQVARLFGPDGWETSRSSGRRRASSALQTVSSVSMWLRIASDRSRSTTGPHGSLPAASYARADATTCPSARTRRPSSSARRDFPIPGSPVTNKRCAPTLPRGIPCLVELVQLEVAAHERRLGDGRQVLALHFVAVECASPELVVHGPDRLARCHREVALKHLRAPVVGAQRRGSIAKREMCFHLNSNGRFVGRFQIDDALGMPDRGFVVVALRSLFSQPHEGPIRLSSKFCSLVQHPVVITSWKEIARIEARGELEITGRHGIAEPQHVDLGWPSRNPPHSLVVDLDELTDVGKGMTEVVEQLSEVGACLTLVGVGPQLERES